MRNNVATLQEIALRSTAESLFQDLTSNRNTSHVTAVLKWVPHKLADDLTNQLLLTADTKYGRFNWSYGMVVCIIHEKIKILNLTDVPKFGKDVTKSLTIIPNKIKCLESFIFEDNCGDEDFLILKQFTQITEVDVRGSYEVTDRVVDYLVNLKKLQRLNLEGTQITPFGISRILQVNNQLTELSVNNVFTSDINAMKELTNLTSLELDVNDSDVSALKYLNNLHKIGLRKCHFHQVNRLFSDIGHNLFEIRLEEVQQIDLQVMGKELSSLKKLLLKKCSHETPIGSLEDFPAYCELEELEIIAEEVEIVKHLLMGCKNLEIIRLKLRSRLKEQDLSRIIKKNRFMRLRTFSLYTSRVNILNMVAIEELLNTATHLISFTHLGVGTSNPEIEDLQRTYPHANINITTTNWSEIT